MPSLPTAPEGHVSDTESWVGSNKSIKVLTLMDFQVRLTKWKRISLRWRSSSSSSSSFSLIGRCVCVCVGVLQYRQQYTGNNPYQMQTAMECFEDVIRRFPKCAEGYALYAQVWYVCLSVCLSVSLSRGYYFLINKKKHVFFMTYIRVARLWGKKT